MSTEPDVWPNAFCNEKILYSMFIDIMMILKDL